MSTRNVPRTLDERVAALESYVRAVRAQQAVEPTDARYLYSARGDILVALGPADPQPMPVPLTSAPSSGAYVPRFNPGSLLSVEWAWIDAPGMTVIGV